ncbi:MAG: spore germination protein GerW family protein [Chloroflexota bacterium]
MDGNDELEFDDDFEEEFDDGEFDGEIYPYRTNPSIAAVENTMETFLSTAAVDAVYGEPVRHQETVILPAAEIVSVVGFGVGLGQGGDDEGSSGDGGGGGGGGRVFSRPVAVVIASPQGVRVEPVLDLTKIVIAGITALTFMLGMRARFGQVRRALENIE